MADSANPKQDNTTNNSDNIPLSEDLLFNYISGLTSGSTPAVQNNTPPPKKTTTTPQNNAQQTTTSSSTLKNTQSMTKSEDTSNDIEKIKEIKAQLQEEIQKKQSPTLPSKQTTFQNKQSGVNIQSTQPPTRTITQTNNIEQPQVNNALPTNPSTQGNHSQQGNPTNSQKNLISQANINSNVPQISNTIPAKEISMPLLLEEVIKRNASDLHLAVGYPPLIRIDGALIAYGSQPLNPTQIEKLIYSILSPEKRDILEVNKEVDFGYGYKNLGRFRVNAYHSKGFLAAALRLIPNRIRTIEELHLPKMYHELSNLEQGFVLVTGPTGHGKSTTLAAIIQEINLKYPKHILTVEDPIEYVFPPAKALVTQRELGEDTNSWKIALRSALREDPDVVLIGEMRDYETIAAAINIAETGHLVFSTLHTNSASQTIDRIISVFPSEQQNKVRSQLAEVIKVIISQRLIPLKTGGRIPVSEVMIINNAIKNLIREGKIYQIDNVIRTAAEEGMISLERSLVELVRQKLITLEEARKYAWNPDEINRLISMAY